MKCFFGMKIEYVNGKMGSGGGACVVIGWAWVIWICNLFFGTFHIFALRMGRDHLFGKLRIMNEWMNDRCGSWNRSTLKLVVGGIMSECDFIVLFVYIYYVTWYIKDIPGLAKYEQYTIFIVVPDANLLVNLLNVAIIKFNPVRWNVTIQHLCMSPFYIPLSLDVKMSTSPHSIGHHIHTLLFSQPKYWSVYYCSVQK